MRTIIMLHGWGFTPRIWDPLRAWLGDFRLLTPDLNNGVATLAARADAVSGAIDPDAVLVGWSLGAMLAIELARRHPAKVRALCLIGTTQRFVANTEWPHGLDGGVVSAFRRDFAENPARTIRRFMALQTLGDARRLPLQRQLESALADPKSAGLAEGLAILETADLRDTVLPETLSMLLIHGVHDALMPVDAARTLASSQASAQLHEIPDAGHCPLFTDPERLAGLIRSFTLEC